MNSHTNWPALAKARGLEISARDLDRIAAPLRLLEEAFRPLTSDLSPDLDPCTIFRVEPGAGE
jgi:hypothetical protein